jgi:hypothetical protein
MSGEQTLEFRRRAVEKAAHFELGETEFPDQRQRPREIFCGLPSEAIELETKRAGKSLPGNAGKSSRRERQKLSPG